MNRPGEHSSLLREAGILSTLLALSNCAPAPDTAGARGQTASQVDRLEPAVPADREWFVNPLIPSDDTPNNRFGWDVAVSVGTAVVGAPDLSAAYVFVLGEDGWHEQAALQPPPGAEQYFGGSVAISGDTVIVAPITGFGASVPGAVYVYARSGASWSLQQTLAADDGGAEHQFGYSVAIFGDTAVVGAPYAETGVSEWGSEGAVYVFTRSGSTWTQTRKLFAEDGLGSDAFGSSVAVRNGTVLVGAPLAPEGTTVGRAWFFEGSGADWTTGQTVSLAEPYCCDEFGYSVALGDDIAVVGARSHRGRNASAGEGYRQGAAFVFTKSTSGWTQQTNGLIADDGMDFDGFGTAVAVSGSTVIVGAPGSGGTHVGGADSVYVFSPLASPLIEDRIGSRGDIEFFGGSVDLDADVGVVGTNFGQNGAYAVELRATDGSPCDSNWDCGARHCVGGVCCNVACSGACETCASGTCTPLPQSPGTPSCSPYLCGEAGGGCPTSCTAHSHCADTHYCLDQRCVPRLTDGESCAEARDCESGRCVDDKCAGTMAIGMPCSNAFDCETGFCVDGFCCDQLCEQQCEACDVDGAHGTCSPFSGAPRGERPSCEGADTICGGECDGQHTAGCAYPTRAKACSTSCSDGLQTDSACDGQGACEAGPSHSCGGYACEADGLACRTRCDATAHCAVGFTCVGESCEPGASCLDDWTAQGADGTLQGCAPYRCNGGGCRTTCDASTDCTDDSVCNRDGHCVPSPPASPSSSDAGRGCSMALGTSTAGWALWAAAVLVVRIVRLRARKPNDNGRSSSGRRVS